jgi:hypothetical protein
MIDKINILLTRFSVLINCETGAESDPSCGTNLPQVAADADAIKLALGIVFGILAGVALIIILLQGLKFVMSKGEPDRAVEARKAIIYAAVGLGISLLAEAVVVFVLGRVLA